MNHEALFADLTDKTIATIFTEFMTRYAVLEELVKAGNGFLRGFCRELEILKRSPLSKESILFDIIKANCTDKLKEYVDADLSTHQDFFRSIMNLDSCKLGLEDNLLKAKEVLDELENLMNSGADKINQSMDNTDAVFKYDAKEQMSHLVQENVQDILSQDESVSRAILMISICSMLKLEFTIQEKIIGAIGLETSVSELEDYCMMWELRPYVKCNVIHLAWNYISA